VSTNTFGPTSKAVKTDGGAAGPNSSFELIRGRVVGPGATALTERTGRDGERRFGIQLVADAVQFLDPPKRAADPGGGVADPAHKPADRPAVGAYRRRAG
jgi:hypothetical protein